MDKIFVLDNFKIVLDKKHFVQADGQGTNMNDLPILPISSLVYKFNNSNL